jgi:hypothetical protein
MCGCGVSVLVLIFAANDMIDHDVPKVYQPPTIHDLECSTICLYILQLLPLECNFLLSKEDEEIKLLFYDLVCLLCNTNDQTIPTLD